MTNSNWSRLVEASLVATFLAGSLLTHPAQAQTNAPGTNTQPNSNVEATGPIREHTNRDRDDNLGWFGLLGLIGLAGLARKKHQTTVHHVNNDPNVATHSGSDYR